MKLDVAQRMLVIASIVTVVMMASDLLRPFLLPVMFLNTHIHELAHAIAALLTGGLPERIEIYANGSGVTPVSGGNILIVGSAGYLGASLFGAWMIWFARDDQRARWVLNGLAFLLLASLLILVRGNWVGPVTAIFLCATCYFLARTNAPYPIFFAQLIGVQQCLNSLQSVWTVFKISRYPIAASDARILEQVTGIPATGWAALWVILSLVFVAISLRRVATEGPKRPPKASRRAAAP